MFSLDTASNNAVLEPRTYMRIICASEIKENDHKYKCKSSNIVSDYDEKILSYEYLASL